MIRRLVLSAALLIALVAWNMPMRDSSTWMDEVTGSMKSQRSWLVFRSPPRFEASSIERWIVAREGRYDHRWRFLSGRPQNLFGQTLGWACGTAPEICLLHAGDLNDRFVQHASDAEIAEFVRVMRHGTRAEQRDAVEAACNLVIDRSKADGPRS